tara:strand:- start:986 stop:1171 length:186 start_codon:yes stop_codon:yes gene_type:complete
MERKRNRSDQVADRDSQTLDRGTALIWQSVIFQLGLEQAGQIFFHLAEIEMAIVPSPIRCC